MTDILHGVGSSDSYKTFYMTLKINNIKIKQNEKWMILQ